MDPDGSRAEGPYGQLVCFRLRHGSSYLRSGDIFDHDDEIYTVHPLGARHYLMDITDIKKNRNRLFAILRHLSVVVVINRFGDGLN